MRAALLLLLLLATGGAHAFAPSSGGRSTVGVRALRDASVEPAIVEGTKTASVQPAQPPSRRDVLSSAASAVAIGFSALVSGPNDASAFRPGPVTAQSAANQAAYAQSYQGVWSDPNHPEGYRVILAKGKGAVMTFSDGVAKDAPEGTEEKTYRNIPVAAKEGSNELAFDFSFKGGPKGVVGTLSSDNSKITFPDGNAWTKNSKALYEGVYKDPAFPNGYRVLRKLKSQKTITEINDTGNPADSRFVLGEHASLFSIPTAGFTFFDLTGKETCSQKLCRTCDVVCKDEVVGQFSLEDKNTVFPYGTITFPDKTIWTRI